MWGVAKCIGLLKNEWRITLGIRETGAGMLKLRLWAGCTRAGMKPARWWALLGTQVFARVLCDSYWLDEGHFPFRMAWQILSRRLIITLSWMEETEKCKSEWNVEQCWTDKRHFYNTWKHHSIISNSSNNLIWYLWTLQFPPVSFLLPFWLSFTQ